MSTAILSSGHLRAWIIAVAAAALTAGGGFGDGRSAHAAEPVPEPLPQAPSAAEAADKLHELAKTDYNEGRKDKAIEYWREAQRLDPNWKYAYNLSNALYEVGNLIDSWEFIRESERLGLPARYLDKLGELRTKIQLDLLQTHAYLQLVIEPADVVVTLDGEPFNAPFAKWVARASSHVVVSREGYLTHEQDLAHAIGQRHTVEVRLERAPAVLVVTGTPATAKVRVDGNVIGSLPEAGPALLTAGRHDVHASARGYRAKVQTLEVKAGQKAHVTFELEPVDTGVPLDTYGWISAGVSGAALIASAVCLVTADGVSQDLRALNGDAAALGAVSYDEYRADYAREAARYDDFRTAGFVLMGVGVAAAIASVSLILYPEDEDGEPAEVTPPSAPGSITPTTPSLAPIQGGFSVVGGFHF